MAIARAGIFLIIVSHLFPNNHWQNFSFQTDNLAKIETIFLDNKYIQTYKNQVGIWIESTSYSYFSKKFGIKVSKIKQINKSSKRKSGKWIFYPYSKKYITELYKQGIKRQTVVTPNGELIWPVKGMRITSRVGNRWGKTHTGIDIASARGSFVLAAATGTVSSRGYEGAFGISLVTENNGIQYRYGHLSAVLVRKGDKIKKGQIIALSGNTGRSTGPHLHFEIRCMGMVLNPENFLPGFKESMDASSKFHSILRQNNSNKL